MNRQTKTSEVIFDTYLWSSPADAGQETASLTHIPFLGESEIDQDGNVIVRDQHVGWFDVVVRDTPFVEIADGRCELAKVG